MDTTHSDDDSPHGVLTPLSRLAGGSTILESQVRGVKTPIHGRMGNDRRPALCFLVRLKFCRVEVAIEIPLTFVGENIDPVSEKSD